MFRYLKDDQYYIDRYDLYTIEECLSYSKGIRGRFENKKYEEEFKKFNKEEFDREANKVTSLIINIIEARMYEHKKEAIHKWMEQDRKMQEKFDNAVPPYEVLCNECSSPTRVMLKDLRYLGETNNKVLFIFECLKCKKRQALYEDGTKWHSEKPRCPECNSPLDDKYTYNKNVLATIYSCPNCSYRKEEVDDFNKSEKEQEAREARENKLLAEYRKEFCVDDKTGEEMLRSYEQLSRLVSEFKEKEKKDKDPLIQKARQLKKITVIQLRKLVEGTLEKEGYIDLKFGKPEIGKHVIIDFSVIETEDNREEYNSQNTFKKLINRLLKNTNWRLMSDGIHYRLGILTGRLKAYEREEDLVRILKERKSRR